ncbi:hypothetical protein BDW42DRAFT_162180 [Aspergillus taichungensis]|uniref:Uncharacterized protein n=1 Tax=Aspergillus taichungensis TaxID=482145 RepID=A0A2J5I3S0_9EURO|nr:hypothetical protein BDW42DRAFT_162180 [Aspergillus taichungensis]
MLLFLTDTAYRDTTAFMLFLTVMLRSESIQCTTRPGDQEYDTGDSSVLRRLILDMLAATVSVLYNLKLKMNRSSLHASAFDIHALIGPVNR